MSDESSDETEGSESETEIEDDPAVAVLTSVMAVGLHTCMHAWCDLSLK